MKRHTEILQILFLVFILFISSGSGIFGSYTIFGKANFKSDDIANDTINIFLGDRKYDVKTDSSGMFEFCVNWHTACPSGKSRIRTRKITKEINPKYIYFVWKDYECKIKNKWHKYRNQDVEIELNFKPKTFKDIRHNVYS